VPSPTAIEFPGYNGITNVSYAGSKYTTHNGEFFGMFNMLMSANSNYGGTRSHWDIELPYIIAGKTWNAGGAGKPIGQGFWQVQSAPWSIPSEQGKIVMSTFPNLPGNMAIQAIKTSVGVDQWAIDNLSYDWAWNRQLNGNSGSARDTGYNNSSWSWWRLGLPNYSVPVVSANDIRYTLPSPRPAVKISACIRYMMA
jgi:hypothetical protein